MTKKDIPKSFLQGIKDIEEGRTVDMDVALSEPFPQDAGRDPEIVRIENEVLITYHKAFKKLA